MLCSVSRLVVYRGHQDRLQGNAAVKATGNLRDSLAKLKLYPFGMQAIVVRDRITLGLPFVFDTAYSYGCARPSNDACSWSMDVAPVGALSLDLVPDPRRDTVMRNPS
jgi:hypothetical protein